VLAAPAVAAPVNSPRSEQFTLSCPGGDVAIVPAPGNGIFTPGFIVGTHKLLIPYRFTLTATGGGQIFTKVNAKKAPVPANASTCTSTSTFTEDGVTYTSTFAVTGVVRGKP
jgi:hypothetical protein